MVVQLRILGILALAGLPAFADTAAVLPFWNAASSPNNTQNNLDWIGESVAETVREALGSRGVLTIERQETSGAFHDLQLRERTELSLASVIKLGESLDAEQLIFGSFEFTPAPGAPPGVHGSLHLAGRIFDLRHMRAGPEFVETGSIEDLATLEAHLAWRTLALIAPKLAPLESDFRMLRASIRLDAEESYIRGLLARDPEQQEKFFLQAARLDSRFAHACYQLGQIHYRRKEYRQAVDWLEKVGPEDLHARAAGFLLGLARYQSADYAGAQKEFQKIAAAFPLSEVLNNLGAAESRRNLPQALDDFKKAAAGDPSDPVYQFNLGYALWRKGDFAPAADAFRAVLARAADDSMATLLLGRCLKKQGFNAATDTRFSGLERLKTDYQERAYRQLKAMLEPKAP
jgi:tetratricopeptide (TPR) repeat protein